MIILQQSLITTIEMNTTEQNNEMTNPVEKLTVKTHDPTIALPAGLYDSTEGIFGIVTVKIRDDAKIPTGTYLFNFEKDGSGSMSELTEDGKSKDYHIRTTICNTLEALARIAHENQQVQIYVRLCEFDTTIHQVLAATLVTAESVVEMTTTVRTRKLPGGNTNIEAALKNSVLSCEQFLAEHPDAHVISVITTDGDTNAGDSNQYSLAKIVKNKHFQTICIGYGASHNSALLIGISSSYFYVADLERAGETIGEILHDFLYIAVEKVELRIVHGEVFAEDQTWNDVISCGNAIGGSSKVYSIHVPVLQHVAVLLYGKREGDRHMMMIESQTTIQVVDLTRDIFRHKTVQLLAEAQQNLTTVILAPIHPRFHSGEQEQYAQHMVEYKAELTIYVAALEKCKADKKDIRLRLKTFFRMMKDYAKEKDMEQEPMMKQLLDDVYSIWLAFGRHFDANEARAYTQAKFNCNLRQTSGNTSMRPIGMQRVRPFPNMRRQNAFCNSVPVRAIAGAFDDDEDVASLQPPATFPMRQLTCAVYPGMERDLYDDEERDLEDEEDLEDDLEHELTDEPTSAYATPKALTLMREISSHARP